MNVKKKMFFLSGGGASLDADYQTWLTQVQTDDATFTPSASLKVAQSAFIVALKAISAGDVWTHIRSIYFLHCGSLTVGRRNVKDISTYRTTLSGTNTFLEGSGTKSNGTSYINQPLASNAWANQEINFTCAQYVSESSTDFASFYATHGYKNNLLVDRYLYLQPLLDATHGDLWNCGLAGFNFLNADHKKRYITTYDLAGTLSVIHVNGTKQSTLLASPGGIGDLAINRFILAVNNNGSPIGHYTKYLAYDMVIDRAVTDAEAALIDSAMTTYNTAVGF